MPELPEVETVVRGMREPLVGRTITEMLYDWRPVIRTPEPEEFASRIVGQTVQAVNRRAKYIIVQLDYDLLVVHLKMTGRLYVTPQDEVHDADRWVHFRLRLDNDHELRFSDARKFGKVYLTHDFSTLSSGTAALGPEPLSDEFTPDVLQQRLRGRNKQIKALLLDQSFIAGVGNIYADEALIRAGIHPERRAATLTEDEVARLYTTVRAALMDGITHEGASVNWYRKADGTKGSSQEHLYAYGRTGEPCRNCGQPITKLWVAQRGTHICSNCQPFEEKE